MKKILSFFVGAMAAANVLSAQMMPNSGDCSCWDPTEFYYGLNPPVHCPAENCGHFGVYGDLLWMKMAQESSFGYGTYKVETDQLTVGAVPEVNRKILSFKRTTFDPDWELGFRLGLTYNRECDAWGIDANWTYFYDKSSKKSPSAEGTFTNRGEGATVSDTLTGSFVVPPLMSGSGAFENADNYENFKTSSQVSSSFKVRLNQFDIDVTREFYVGPAMTLRPYAGFRALFIEESINTSSLLTLSGEPLGATSTLTTNQEASQQAKVNTHGFGAHAGFEMNFEICEGFSLFANLGSGLLYTHADHSFHNNTIYYDVVTENDVTTSTPTGVMKLTNNESDDAIKFCADFMGGIQWACLYDCNQNKFFVKAGWEHHVFVGHNSFRYYNQSTILGTEEDQQIGTFDNLYGDLSLYGFVLRAGVTF